MSEIEFRVKDKYAAVQRAYHKLLQVATNNGNHVTDTDATDATDCFFYHCYHLKDWVKNVGVLEVEDYINKSTYLCIASDYCNASKHAKVKPKSESRTKKSFEKLNKHYYLFCGNGSTAVRLSVTLDGEQYSVPDIAKGCVEEWRAFFQSYPHLIE